MARRRKRITEFRSGDRSNIIESVKLEFGVLAKGLEENAERQIAMSAFRKRLLPMVEEMRGTKLFDKLPRAKFFKACNETFSIPTDAGIVPQLEGLTAESRYSFGYAAHGMGSAQELAEYANDENRDKVEKAGKLRVKSSRVEELLAEFLEKFTHADQVPFSLPEVHQFIPRVRCQKRPRVVVQPSEELRRLVREAGMLRLARNAPRENEAPE